MSWREICAAFEQRVVSAKKRWHMSAASIAPISAGLSGPNAMSRSTTSRASPAGSKLKRAFCWMTVLNYR